MFLLEKYFTYLERLSLMLHKLFQQHIPTFYSKIWVSLHHTSYVRKISWGPLNLWGNSCRAKQKPCPGPRLEDNSPFPSRFGKTKQIFTAPASILLCPWKVFSWCDPSPPPSDSTARPAQLWEHANNLSFIGTLSLQVGDNGSFARMIIPNKI